MEQILPTQQVHVELSLSFRRCPPSPFIKFIDDEHSHEYTVSRVTDVPLAIYHGRRGLVVTRSAARGPRKKKSTRAAEIQISEAAWNLFFRPASAYACRRASQNETPPTVYFTDILGRCTEKNQVRSLMTSTHAIMIFHLLLSDILADCVREEALPERAPKVTQREVMIHCDSAVPRHRPTCKLATSCNLRIFPTH